MATTVSNEQIRDVLQHVAERPFTILNFIPVLKERHGDTWNSIVKERGKGGKGSGVKVSAYSIVAFAINRLVNLGELQRLEYVAAPKDFGSPVIRTWTDGTKTADHLYPDELTKSAQLTINEGELMAVVVNRYERNPEARRKCIEHYGTACTACGVELSDMYGEHGDGFIHVHHLTPLSKTKKAHAVDPITDLRPVCPNCHAMIHHREPMLSIDKLQEIILSQTNAD